eukprot:3294187-Amphidinium_carterae.1
MALGATNPLEGWLLRGSWASWSEALKTLREFQLAAFRQGGLKLRVDKATAHEKLRTLVRGTSRQTLHQLQRSVDIRWHMPDRWNSKAVASISATCKHASPACSAAYVKLLLGFVQMPLRRRQGHTRACVFCGHTHFSTLLVDTIRYGCFRPALAHLRTYCWLQSARPTIWLDLILKASEDRVAAKQLGMLSRVMAEAVYAARRDEAAIEGSLIPVALVAIGTRS